MCNMLFVNGSHSLSPYIYSHNSKFGHLPDKDHIGFKEKLDPSARLAKLYMILDQIAMSKHHGNKSTCCFSQGGGVKSGYYISLLVVYEWISLTLLLLLFFI